MEKPEWFEAVDALDSAPGSVIPVRARTSRLMQGFVLFGVAAVVAAGGFAFAQSTKAPATEALSSVNATPAQTPIAAATPVATQVATQVANSSALATSGKSVNSASGGTSTGRTAIALTGGRPSITGAAAVGGDDGNDGND